MTLIQRVELLAKEVEALEQSGGGGATTNYNSLTNKPSINNQVLIGNKSLADLGAATPSDITDVFAPSGITIEEGGTFPSGSRVLLAEHKPIMVNDDQYYFLEESGVDYLYGGLPTSGAYPSISYFRVMKQSFKVEFHDTAIDTVPTEDSTNLITSGAVYDAVQGGGGDLSDYLTKSEASSTYETQSAAAASLSQKVDKVQGKGLSENDFTTAEKTKLAGIETNANYITVDTAVSATSHNPVRNSAIYSALMSKVDKVVGKGLSTEDFTTAEKSSLAALSKLNTTTQTIDLNSQTWTQSANGLYYTSNISVQNLDTVYATIITGFSALKATDNVNVIASSNRSAIRLTASVGTFSNQANITVAVFGSYTQ